MLMSTSWCPYCMSPSCRQEWWHISTSNCNLSSCKGQNMQHGSHQDGTEFILLNTDPSLSLSYSFSLSLSVTYTCCSLSLHLIYLSRLALFSLRARSCALENACILLLDSSFLVHFFNRGSKADSFINYLLLFLLAFPSSH